MNHRNCYRPLLGTFIACAAFALLLGLPHAVLSQQKIYDSTGFERQPFVAGLPLLGLDGWSQAIPPFLNPLAARITNAASQNGRQSVEVWGANLAGSGGITAPYDAIGSYRRPLEYTVKAGKSLVRVEADMLLQTQQPAAGGIPPADDFFTMTISARSDAGATLGEIGLSSTGNAVAYGFDVPPGSIPVVKVPAGLNQWHRVGIVLNYSDVTTSVAYTLNGQIIGVMPTNDSSKILLRGAMVVYALPDGGGKARINYTARFDNYQVSVQGNHSDNDD